MMSIEVASKKPHVVIAPFPKQGHINPILCLAKSLASKGVLVTLIITESMANSAKFSDDCSSMTIHTISGGSEHANEVIGSHDGYINYVRSIFSLPNLTKFLDEERSSCVKAIIYDSLMPWVQDIARERGLLAAPFFVYNCGTMAVFYHLKQGLLLKYPYEEKCTMSLPALPPLEKKDLPSFDPFVAPLDQIVLKIITDQFMNLETADCIFLNTFDKLETEIIEWMRSMWAITTVGPTFLLDTKDDNLRTSKNHDINLFELKDEHVCKEWLDARKNGSVVYVSFGSLVSLSKEQMEELAYGLIASNVYFLWVVRSSEVDKFPQDFTSEKGLIVEWCNQREVLTHPAISCFITHCGWSSTLEALSNGVPLVAMDQFGDQNPTGKFVGDVWKIGIRVERGENGIVGRDEIARCIKQVVEGDEGIEVKRNVSKWKELASEAVQNGGTSANNVDDFVSKIMQH